MGQIPGYYIWDDDSLTPGLKKEGGLHQNLYKDGRLVGNARFVPADDVQPIVTETVYIPIEDRRRAEVDDELEEAVRQLLFQLIGVGIKAATPVAARWWRDTARPAIEARRTRMAERRSRRRKGRGKSDNAAGSGSAAKQAAGNLPTTGPRPRMSKAEAQARWLAATAAQAYSEEQMRLVAEAEIVDGTDLEELRRSLSELPAGQVQALVEAMATDPAMLTDSSVAQLASLLGQRQALGR